MIQLRVFKYEKGDYLNEDTQEKCHDANKESHCALLFIVDTVKQQSVALICGAREQWLVEKAFPEGQWAAAAPGVKSPSAFIKAEQTLCNVGSLVSRKLDFVPKCTEALKSVPLPEWYMQTSKEMERLGRVLATSHGALTNKGQKVEWDRQALRSAVWTEEQATGPCGGAAEKLDKAGDAVKPAKCGWRCAFLTGGRREREVMNEI